MIAEIRELAGSLGGELSESRGVYTLCILVAQRKAFFSRKTLEYIAKFRINDQAKEIVFTEMLKESGSGLSIGGDQDNMSPGFGFKATAYKTGMGGREGTIEEQSNLFGKTYDYKFDFKRVRVEVEDLARGAGYVFKYKITPIGL